MSAGPWTLVKKFDFFRQIFKKIVFFRQFHKNIRFSRQKLAISSTPGQTVLFLFKSHHIRTYFLYIIRYNTISRFVHDPTTPLRPPRSVLYKILSKVFLLQITKYIFKKYFNYFCQLLWRSGPKYKILLTKVIEIQNTFRNYRESISQSITEYSFNK